MLAIHQIDNPRILSQIKWNCDAIVLTVVYGNQDIHEMSIENLTRVSSNTTKLSLIIIDNKGDYNVDRLKTIDITKGCELQVYIYKRMKKSRLENDAAYNHSSAIDEVFDIFQKQTILTNMENNNPLIILLDPDFFITDVNYQSYLRDKLNDYDIIGTRWTIVKTHKFHNFPTPHLFATDLERLRKIPTISFKSKPIRRDICKWLFKLKLLHYFAMYNSYDPGCRMNGNSHKKATIKFIEQYYWREDIDRLIQKHKKRAARCGKKFIANSLPRKSTDETSFWIESIVNKIPFALFNILKNKRHLIRISDVYSEILVKTVKIKYFDNLPMKLVPKKNTSADIFFTDKNNVFGIHGHMYSKARSKADFLEYLGGFYD